MNINQALKVLKVAKPDKVQKALLIARTHVDCFGTYGKAKVCACVSAICLNCKDYTEKADKVKDDTDKRRSNKSTKKRK